MQNEKTSTTSSDQDLITKFYYNNNHLCFQILVKANGESTPYMEFTDYNEYRKVFNGLTEKKSRGEFIETRSTNTELTNMSFV